MTSKIIALKILDGLFVVVAAVLLLAVVGAPADWLMDLIGLSWRDFQAFALFHPVRHAAPDPRHRDLRFRAVTKPPPCCRAAVTLRFLCEIRLIPP
jgi:hypothetical protein